MKRSLVIKFFLKKTKKKRKRIQVNKLIFSDLWHISSLKHQKERALSAYVYMLHVECFLIKHNMIKLLHYSDSAGSLKPADVFELCREWAVSQLNK